MSDQVTLNGAGATEIIERHNAVLWEAIEADVNPFLAPMRAATRERLIKALKANRDLIDVILKRYLDQP